MEKFERREVHPFAEKFPLMSDSEFQGFVDDIRHHGQRETIKTYQGKIIDGRNREAACYVLGIPPHYEVWDEKGSLIDYIISVNLHRRHLSVEQKAMLGAELAEMKKGSNSSTELLLSQSDAAKLLNVSISSIKRAKTIIADGVLGLPEKVRAGEISLAQAEKIAREPKTKQMRLIRKAGKKVIACQSDSKVHKTKHDPIHFCLLCNKDLEVSPVAFENYIDYMSNKLGGIYARSLQNMLEDFIGIKTLSDIQDMNERIEAAFAYGIHEFSELEKTTKIPREVLEEILRVGVFNNCFREEKQGGKGNTARGARKRLFFVKEQTSQIKTETEICAECFEPVTDGKEICRQCLQDKNIR